MDSSVKHPKKSPQEGPSKPHFKPEHKLDSKELREASDVAKGAYVEAVGMDETVETTGRVSEVLGETKDGDKGAAAGAKGKAKKFDPTQIRKELLKKLPSEKAMRSQIEREIKKEIDYLHKKAMKMLRKPGEMNYFEMSNIMRKIRELRGILLRIGKAAVDSLKTLWLRYVHGVM